MQAAGGAASVVLSAAACGGGASTSDPPLLVPWSRIGDIALGEPKARVEREYGVEREPQGYYRLHGSRVYVDFENGRVNAIGFTTPYYRTKSGFGVGSRIPLGPCHTSPATSCEHRWHGFVWNVRLREKPCGCWTKVGLGKQSLPVTGANFLEPWFFIYTSGRRVTRFYFSRRYID